MSSCLINKGILRYNATVLEDNAVMEKLQQTSYSLQLGLRGFFSWRKMTRGAHLLADLTGDIRLQASCEDLVDDAVAVVGIIGFLPIVICVDTKKKTTYTQSLKAMLCNFTALLSAHDLQGEAQPLTAALVFSSSQLHTF